VSSIRYAKNYLKRITIRLLGITRDENPGERMRLKTEDKQKVEDEIGRRSQK
jgi:hypothetical protein